VSARALPREMGLVINCNGTTDKGCPHKEKFMTALIVVGNTRGWLKTQGWGRGLRKGHKRRDLCPKCMPVETKLHKEAKAAWQAEIKRREEKRKADKAARDAKRAAEALAPKKPRRKKGDAAASSPQAACEEYLPTPSPSAVSAPAPST
jgi:hypothetical protein